MAEITFESTSRFVDLPMGKMHYNEAGEGNEQVLILIHGSGAGATGWANFRGNFPALSEHFHVYAVDSFGWGLSDPIDHQELDQAEMMLQFVDALGIKKASLVGNSMGGMITLAFTARHQDRVDKMITMGSGFMVPGTQNIFNAAGLTEGLKILQKGYREPTPAVMKELTSIMAFDQKFSTDELAQLRSDSANANPEHLKNFIANIGKPRRTQTEPTAIAAIKVPSLIIHGRDDRVVPMENSLRLVSVLENSAAVIINQCGHWAQIEHEDYFNRIVIDFVKNGKSQGGDAAAIGG